MIMGFLDRLPANITHLNMSLSEKSCVAPEVIFRIFTGKQQECRREIHPDFETHGMIPYACI